MVNFPKFNLKLNNSLNKKGNNKESRDNEYYPSEGSGHEQDSREHDFDGMSEYLE